MHDTDALLNKRMSWSHLCLDFGLISWNGTSPGKLSEETSWDFYP